MHIAIIGTGNVGSALGKRWGAAGHAVTYGSRHPDSEDTQALVRDTGPKASAASPEEAVQHADAVLLATPWHATENAVKGLGDLGGKVLIDATNPLAPDLGGLVVGHDTSGAEEVARWAKGARVVTAFNSTAASNMADADYGGPRPAMFIAGDDAEAKRAVSDLAEAIGFEAIDSGPLKQARYLEPLAMLYITQAYVQGAGPNIAFALLRR
ncbi:MAG: NADPH-dependent F420 reductase [Rhodothermales bacterium]|nr:NADPH-dependent F420 reductase [Rhodothermales bacterium]